MEYYSFSIPWTRSLPFVLPGAPVNKQAIDHYNDLIKTVLDAGMQPVVSMLHLDSLLVSHCLPQINPSVLCKL